MNQRVSARRLRAASRMLVMPKHHYFFNDAPSAVTIVASKKIVQRLPRHTSDIP
jgi:hypothetical protein